MLAEMRQQNELRQLELRQNIEDAVSMITAVGESLQRYADRTDQDFLRLQRRAETTDQNLLRMEAAIETLANTLNRRFGGEGSHEQT